MPVRRSKSRSGFSLLPSTTVINIWKFMTDYKPYLTYHPMVLHCTTRSRRAVEPLVSVSKDLRGILKKKAGAPVITGFCNLITLLKIKQILVWPGSTGRACRVFHNPNSEPGENSRLLGLEPSENLHKFRRLNTQSIYAKLFCLLSRYFWLPKSAPWSQGKNLFNPIREVT